jgi:hypothetical protein
MKLPKIYLAHDLADLYARHRAEFLRLEQTAHAPKYDRATLEERFTLPDGTKYYGFPSTVELPLERYARLREFLAYLAAGISAEELTRLVDAADAALAAGIKSGKNAARIGLCLSELRERAQVVLHHELLVHVLAVQLVRQDEEPAVFDQVLHRAKFEQLLAASGEGLPFFFSTRLPELKKLLETFERSPEEWTRYWHASRARLARLESILKVARSTEPSPASGRTSTAAS